MKTTVKLVAAVFGTLLAVFVIIALYLYFIFDPNDYKQQITAWAKEQTGRELTIQGDIRLSVFPWLGVRFGHMTLSNRAGFGSAPFAVLDSVDVHARLLPMLMNREIETQTLTLDGLTLNLVTDKAGNTNWQDLGGRPSPRKQVIADEETSGERTERHLAALAIGGVRVSQAEINWDNRAAGRRISVQHLNIRIGAILPNQPVDLHIGFDAGTEPAVIKGRVTLYGKGLLRPAKGVYGIDDLHLNLDMDGDGLPGRSLQVKLRGTARFDGEKHTLTLSDIIAETLGAKITGKTRLEQITDVPAVIGQLELSGLDTRKLINRFTKTPILTEDSDVFGAASAKVSFDINSHHVDIGHLHAEMDDSILNGTANISDFDHPVTTFNLHVDSLDLDRYLPPDSQGQAPVVTPAAAAAAGAGKLPVAALRALKLNGELEFGTFKAAKLTVSDATLRVKAGGGLVNVRPSAALYGGRYRGDIHLDVRGGAPTLSFDEALDGVHLGPLLKDYRGSDLVTGDATAHARFSLPADPAQLRRGLNGTATVRLTNGSIHGVNIVQLIRDARARVEGRRPEVAGDPQQTDFSELSATLNAADGVVRNHDLSAKTPYLRVTGNGEVSLVTEHIEYRVDAKIVDTPAGQGGEDLADLKGVTIPIRIGGTLSKPSFAPDVQSYLKEHVEGRVKKEIQKQLQQQGQGGQRQVDKKVEELKGKLKKNLDKLFK